MFIYYLYWKSFFLGGEGKILYSVYVLGQALKKINPVPTPNCFFYVLTCDPEMCVKLNFSL